MDNRKKEAIKKVSSQIKSLSEEKQQLIKRLDLVETQLKVATHELLVIKQG